MLFRKHICAKCGARLNVDPYADECTCESCGYRQRVGRGSIMIKLPERRDHTVQKEYEKTKKQRNKTAGKTTHQSATSRKKARRGKMPRIIKLVFSIITLEVLVTAAGTLFSGVRKMDTIWNEFNFGESTEYEDDNIGQTLDGELIIIGYKVYPEESGYINYEILVRNDTEEMLSSIALSVEHYDAKGKKVNDSYSISSCRVSVGQTIAIQDITKVGESASIAVTGYEVESDTGNFIEKTLDEPTESVSLDTPGETILQDILPFEHNAIENNIMTEQQGDVILESLNVTNIGDGYATIEATVTNDSGETMKDINISCTCLDKNGNISGVTYLLKTGETKSGKQATATGTVEVKKDTWITADGYSYTDTDEDYNSGYFQEILKAIPLDK